MFLWQNVFKSSYNFSIIIVLTSFNYFTTVINFNTFVLILIPVKTLPKLDKSAAFTIEFGCKSAV